MIHFFIHHLFLALAWVEQTWYSLTAKQITNLSLSKAQKPLVSIIIVTYNADEYVKKCIESLQQTTYSNFEVIVVDNNSSDSLTSKLKVYKQKNFIQQLYLAKENNFFSEGNNIGASLSAKEAEYFVLLNSDTEIKNPAWLTILMANKPAKGIITFGATNIPFRPDGWCFMIPKKLYESLGKLDEFYQMNWSITDLTIKALQQGYEVKTIINPDKYVKHYGKRSYQKKLHEYPFNKKNILQVITEFVPHKVQALKI
jgi:GT2 family glycosyltransferase